MAFFKNLFRKKGSLSEDTLLCEMIQIRYKKDTRLRGSLNPENRPMYMNWREPEILILMVSYQYFWLNNGGLPNEEILLRIDEDFLRLRKAHKPVYAKTFDEYLTKKVLQHDENYPFQLIQKQSNMALRNVEAVVPAKWFANKNSKEEEEVSIAEVEEKFRTADALDATSTLRQLRFILLFYVPSDRIVGRLDSLGFAYHLLRKGYVIATARTMIF